LNRVGAGFVEGVAARDRSLNLRTIEAAHGYASYGMAQKRGAAARPHDGDGGNDIVLSAAQGPEHPASLLRIGLFTEDRPVQGDECVGGDDDGVGVNEARGFSLRTGEAAGEDFGVATGRNVLVDVDGTDFEWELEPGKEVVAARGGGGQDYIRQSGKPTNQRTGERDNRHERTMSFVKSES